MRARLGRLLGSAILTTAIPLVAAAGGVVGQGTAESCTNAAFVAALAGGGLVTFDCGSQPTEIFVDTTVIESGTITTIDGGGLITLSGDSVRQLFFVHGGGDLTLRNLSLTNGSAGTGGAVRNGGTARLERVDLSLNFSDNFGGGAIYNLGALTVTDSTFSSNSTTAAGGAIFQVAGTTLIDRCLFRGNEAEDGGAIATGAEDGSIIVTNTTFDTNIATDGGGLYVNGGTVALQNATLDQNQADHGGALFFFAGTVTARNTVFSRSRDRDGTSEALECDGSGADVASLGGNLASDNSCQLLDDSDQNGTDPGLDVLADNGGPTLTLMPLPGSPLIDRGIPAGCPDVDQRGASRPRDGDDADLDAECDVGAVEAPEPAAPFFGVMATLASLALARHAKRDPACRLTVRRSALRDA